MIIFWLTTVGLEIMAISLMCGKGSWMIAGYNTMSKQEKENCNIKKISRAVGIFLSIVGVFMGIFAFIIQYADKNNLQDIILYTALIFTFIVIVGCIVLIIYCQKYDGNKK
ncbi:MAG: DUF3784 domain-containing protein [Clostridium sp.]|uniref:DUF3784 domain-containing protein n=1 Tax=Clostridium sp. TaxID=1506 RepID=UPI003D6CCD37